MSDFEIKIREFITSVYGGNINIENHSKFTVLMLPDKKVAFHAVPVHNVADKNCFALLSDVYQKQGIRLIHLWEDYWVRKQSIVESRVKAILGNFVRLHARKTVVERINTPVINSFLNENHLLGSPACKYKYGLFYNNQLVAAASFSAMRSYWRNGEVFKSAEMVRFANLNGYLVAGGMGKLLACFIHKHRPDDVMSYADREWSSGDSYEKLGFRKIETTPPQQFLINPDTMERHYTHRLQCHSNSLPANNYLSVYNAGNIKYLMYLKEVEH